MAPPSIRKAKRPADDPISQRVKYLYSAAKACEASSPTLAAHLGRQTLKVLQINSRSMRHVFVLERACTQMTSGVCRLPVRHQRRCHGNICSHCAQSAATHGSPRIKSGMCMSITMHLIHGIKFAVCSILRSFGECPSAHAALH